MSLLSRLPLFCVPLFLAVPTRAATLRLLDCTIDSTTLSDCNPTNYFIRVGIFAAPGVLLFVLLWLLCPLYCMGKYCCNCCGGRKQTPNCCCPDLKYPARYSRGDLLRPRILGLIALLLAAGGVGWGLNGVLSLLDGISTVQSDFVNIPQILENQIVLIQNALTVTTYDLSSGTMITTNLFAGSGLQSAAESLRTQLKSNIDTGAAKFQQYLDYFTKIVAAVFGVPLLMILLGQLASLCACRSCCPMFIVWFIFLFGGLLWLGHGLFSGLSMVVGDACAEITGLANQQTNVLPVVLQCKDSMFDDFRNNFKQLEQTQATSTCTLLLSSCYDSSQSAYNNVAAGQILDCPDPSTINCTSIDFGTLYTLVKTTISLDANIATVPGAVSGGYYCHTSSPCTLPLCSTECLLGGASGQYRGVSGNLSLAAYSGFQAANQIANAIDTVGAQYSNCDSVIGTIMNPVAKPCSSLTTGMQYARQSSGIEGVGVIIALFVFAWGAKRFIPLDEADKPQMDGRELDDLDKDGLK